METILKMQSELTAHPVYSTLNTLDGVRSFMRYHVFAVWDFMSLLKSLQKEITCTTLPWTPSRYPAEMVRLINQIVLGEESDLDQNGQPTSHFDLYLKSMEEVGASTSEIRDFLSNLNLNSIPVAARDFVAHNLEVAHHGHVVEVAASFFFGREKLIPAMFTSIVEVLDREKVNAPTLIYYLKRHIEIDGDEHGPLAMRCLDFLTGNNPELIARAEKSGIEALKMRWKLWDNALREYSNK
jgi:hypothetical protein